MPAMCICYVFICRVDETYAAQPINYLCTGHYCVSKSFTFFNIYTCFIIICALDGTIPAVSAKALGYNHGQKELRHSPKMTCFVNTRESFNV